MIVCVCVNKLAAEYINLYGPDQTVTKDVTVYNAASYLTNLPAWKMKKRKEKEKMMFIYCICLEHVQSR